ncbi:MAG: RNA polymerase sigma factor [Solirubrobacteraceae bacterium]
MSHEEQDGDIGVLYERHAAAVHAYALRRSDRQTAEEVTAQVFLVAWRRRSAVPEEALPWLYGVARRVLAEQRRGASRRRRLTERLHLTASREAAVPELADSGLAEALQRLSGGDRETLLLRYWEELEPPQIAGVLGCSVAAATMRVHRARRRLRDELERQRAPYIEEQAQSRAGTESA